MIVVNGKQYKTTYGEPIYIAGQDGAADRQVLRAYVNGNLVYPEPGNKSVMKIAGAIDTTVTHTHSDQNAYNPLGRSDVNFRYAGTHEYRMKGAFALSILQYSSGSLSYSSTPIALSAAAEPLESGASRYMARSNWGSCPMLPTEFSVHPMLGLESLQTHEVRATGGLSMELLMRLWIDAPVGSPWTAERYYGTPCPGRLLRATPVRPLQEIAGDLNGLHRLYYRGSDISAWSFTGPVSGYRYNVRMRNEDSRTAGQFHRLEISLTDLPVQYHIEYLRESGEDLIPAEGDFTFTQTFCVVNIPIVEKLFDGTETQGEEADLYPTEADLDYIENVVRTS